MDCLRNGFGARMTTRTEPMVTVHLPRSHWNQIVINLEKMTGLDMEEIEILQKVRVTND